MAVGYGVSVWCADSVVTGRFARGALAVALSLYRYFTTPQGTLRGLSDDDEELAFGFDIASYVGAAGEAVATRALPTLMSAHAEHDDRVLSASASVVQSEAEPGQISLLITLHVVLKNAGGTFDLTMSTADGALALLGVTTK